MDTHGIPTTFHSYLALQGTRMSDSTFPSQASPSGQETVLRVQSQPLPSLLEPWTSGVEQNTVQHPYFRDEETEALGKAKTRTGTLALRSPGTEANALLFISG